jgi:hypothetical protein
MGFVEGLFGSTAENKKAPAGIIRAGAPSLADRVSHSASSNLCVDIKARNFHSGPIELLHQFGPDLAINLDSFR